MSKAIKSISDLTPDDMNANLGTERGSYMLDDSLRKFGAGRSVLADKNGKLIAGNKTVEHAAQIGLDDVIVVETDGTKLVVVQRTDLDMDTDPRARALAIADNRIAEVNLEWSPEVISELAAENGTLDGLFSDDELAAILEDLKDEPKEDKGVDIDRAAELQEKWQVQRGNLYAIGSHRLLCGDSTVREDVERLMEGARARAVITDPPYPEEYDHVWDSFSVIYPFCADDSFLVSLFGHYQLPRVISAALEGGWAWFWLAQTPNNNQPIMHGYSVKCSFKPCVVFRKGKANPSRIWIDNFGLRTKTEDWQEAKEAHKWGQATSLFYEPFDAFTKRGDVVLEPFGGGGTTMVAAQELERDCYAMELEEKNCAVILERLSNLGLSPQLIEG